MKIEYQTTVNNAAAWVETSKQTWLSMSHWKKTAITKHIQIEGGDGLGYTFLKGRDNAVCTIQGMCPWSSNAITELDKLDGAVVRVTDGVEGTHTGVSTVTITNGGSNAYINYTLSVTEDRS